MWRPRIKKYELWAGAKGLGKRSSKTGKEDKVRARVDLKENIEGGGEWGRLGGRGGR